MTMIFKKCDAILLFNLRRKDPNLFYFTGLNKEYIFYYKNKNKKKSITFCSELEYEEVFSKNDKSKSIIKKISREPSIQLNEILKKDKVKVIGINKDHISVNEFNRLKKELKVKFVDVSKELEDLRKVKSKGEILKIKKAANITDNIFSKIIINFKKFKTELDVVNFIGNEAKKFGCDLAFPTIVASGKNASMPHYSSKDIKLQRGFCIIDFGVKYQGYCSDMTRTIYLGNPTSNEVALYNKLLQLQKEAILLSQPNNKCSDLDKFVRNGLGKYKDRFIHSLGHGFGIEIHEAPNISPYNDEKLKENILITIEPGIYVSNKFGIRIEDDIIVGKIPEVITKSKKELIVIK